MTTRLPVGTFEHPDPSLMASFIGVPTARAPQAAFRPIDQILAAAFCALSLLALLALFVRWCSAEARSRAEEPTDGPVSGLLFDHEFMMSILP
jgi:hypothetical protein